MKLTPPPITPGPWNLQPDSDAGIHHDGGRWIRTDGLFSVRVIGGDFVSRHRPRIEDGERDANARAIAALPKVLEALEDLLENLDETGLATMPGDTFENMRETIERAKDALLEAGYTITEP